MVFGHQISAGKLYRVTVKATSLLRAQFIQVPYFGVVAYAQILV